MRKLEIVCDDELARQIAALAIDAEFFKSERIDRGEGRSISAPIPSILEAREDHVAPLPTETPAPETEKTRRTIFRGSDKSSYTIIAEMFPRDGDTRSLEEIQDHLKTLGFQRATASPAIGKLVEVGFLARREMGMIQRISAEGWDPTRKLSSHRPEHV